MLDVTNEKFDEIHRMFLDSLTFNFSIYGYLNYGGGIVLNFFDGSTDQESTIYVDHNENAKNFSMKRIYMSPEEINSFALHPDFLKKIITLYYPDGQAINKQDVTISNIKINKEKQELKFSAKIQKNYDDSYYAENITIPLHVIDFKKLINEEHTKVSRIFNYESSSSLPVTTWPSTKYTINENYLKALHFNSQKEKLLEIPEKFPWIFNDEAKKLWNQKVEDYSINSENEVDIFSEFSKTKDITTLQNLKADEEIIETSKSNQFKNISLEDIDYIFSNIAFDVNTQVPSTSLKSIPFKDFGERTILNVPNLAATPDWIYSSDKTQEDQKISILSKVDNILNEYGFPNEVSIYGKA